MTKAELEKKRDLARTLYLSGKEQTEIAEMLGVSRVTISAINADNQRIKE